MFSKKKIPYPQLPDEALMPAICKRDTDAFSELYDRYFDKLVWFASRFVEDTHKAEDIVQEVFMKLIEKPEHFNKDMRFSTWVYTVTSNACKNHLRNEQNRNRIMEETIKPGAVQHAHSMLEIDAKILRQRINSAYNSLNEKEKNIFILRFEQELSLKEIAEIIAIPEGSVKSGIYYLLKKFTPYLKDFSYGQQ
ncbi:MAG: RNA polymerase sigma factor [Bacteroidota bacterium]